MKFPHRYISLFTQSDVLYRVFTDVTTNGLCKLSIIAKIGKTLRFAARKIFSTPVRKDTENGPSEKTIRTNPSVVLEERLRMTVHPEQATCGITYAALHMPRLTGNCPRDAKTTGRSSLPADANKTGCSSHSAEANWRQRQARPHMPRLTGNSPIRRTMGCSAHPASVLLTVSAEPAPVRLCNVYKNSPYRDDSTVSRFLCSSIRRFAA